MLKDIVAAEVLDGYRLRLRFEEGVVDLAPELSFRGVFEPLRDPAYFAQVRVDPDLGTVAWPNGADLDPDVLYGCVAGGAGVAGARRPFGTLEPRTEDIGIDAVATLLRRDPDGNCYAEDGFVVQLKSESEQFIDYRDHQLKWFLAQSQPMFICLVSRKGARISLFPTLHVNEAVLALHADRIRILFCESDNSYPWAGGKANAATVWLGPPLLSWTFTEVGGTT